MRTLTSPKTYDCEICGAAFKSRRVLDSHMCLLHDDCGEARLGAPVTFRCATCGEGFARRGDLLAHLRRLGHGHPAEWDKARPAPSPHPRTRTRSRSS